MNQVTEIDRSRTYDASTHEPHDGRTVLIWTGDRWVDSFRGSWRWRKCAPTHWREMLEGPHG